MANLAKIRPRLYALIAILLLADLAMAIYLVSPLRRGPRERLQELTSAQRVLARTRVASAPLVGMDQKLAHARIDLKAFYHDRFAGEESAVAIELGKLAGETGVRISGAKYKTGDSPVAGVRQMEIEAQLDGEYLGAVKFINALERDQMFFNLKSVGLEQQQGGTVRLRLTMETFLRG